MQHVGEQLVVYLEERTRLRPNEVADEPIAALHALEHHGLGPLGKERFHHPLRFVVRNALARPGIADRLIEDDGSLGEVGGEDVRALGELGHGRAKLGGVGGVHLTVIGHDGVNDAQGLRVGFVDSLDDVYLLGSAQETGVHGVDIDSNALPGFEIIGQNRGRIVHVPAGKRRVTRKKPGWHRTDVATGGREHGNGDAERALAVSAQVVHCSDARDVVPLALIEGWQGAGDLVRHGLPSFFRGLMDQRTRHQHSTCTPCAGRETRSLRNERGAAMKQVADSEPVGRRFAIGARESWWYARAQ